MGRLLGTAWTLLGPEWGACDSVGVPCQRWANFHGVPTTPQTMKVSPGVIHANSQRWDMSALGYLQRRGRWVMLTPLGRSRFAGRVILNFLG